MEIVKLISTSSPSTSRARSVTQACQSAPPASHRPVMGQVVVRGGGGGGVRHGHVTRKLRLKKPLSLLELLIEKTTQTEDAGRRNLNIETKQKRRAEKGRNRERVYLRSSVQPFLIYPSSFQLHEQLHPSRHHNVICLLI